MPTVPFLGSYGDISGSGLMFRNKIINGGFDIWQRGTSFTTNDVYSSDRWVTVVSGTCTHARESSDIPDGSQYVHRWTTGAESSFGQIRQFIETAEVIKLRGQTMTVSCLVKCSAGFSGNANFEIRSSTATDTKVGFNGSDVGGVGTLGQVISSGWTRITRTFTVPANAVGLYVGIVPTVVQSSGVWLSTAQVQLETGPVATPFEVRPVGTELALCQRYYAIIGAGSPGLFNSTTTARFAVRFPTSMRIAPTVTAVAAPAITHPTVNDVQIGSQTTDFLNTPTGYVVTINAHSKVQFGGFASGVDGRACSLNNDCLQANAEL